MSLTVKSIEQNSEGFNTSNRSSSEGERDTQQYLIKYNQLIRCEHQTSNQRAFVDPRTHRIKENFPFTYSSNGEPQLVIDSHVNIDLLIIKRLECLSKLIVKIRVEYQQAEITSYISGSGLIVNNQYIITAAHLFNPLVEEDDTIVPYKRIQFTSLSYAPDQLFNMNNSNVFEAEILIRGLGLGLQPNEFCHSANDIAILHIPSTEREKNSWIFKQTEHVTIPRLSNVNEIKTNSPIYLLSYCSTVRTREDLQFYEDCENYSIYTKENLNVAMHPNHRTVSMGTIIETNDRFIIHNCASLRGASGGSLIDCNGRLVAVHIGVRDEDVHYNIYGLKRLKRDAVNQGLMLCTDKLKNYLSSAIPTWI